MDRKVIEQKVEILRRCVERLRHKTPETAAVLAKDPNSQDILTLNLTPSVQLCVDIGAHLIAARRTNLLPTRWGKPSTCWPTWA